MVQGAAEVVPVSSSAQLALLPWLLRWPPDGDRTALSAGLHAGSCAGIALALQGDLRQLSAPDLARL
ncbi:MAG: Bacitracin resistance protein BacA, partial [Frankiales bacterium]|nr:Bacitracin resistance protein BacA [Frankiales bacterium]